ncbi:hypothetical protein GA0115256_138020 [Streptomyces sp. DconLS]|nr:hypothetical protein GA0115258_112447 [Streptomyces sp. LamerLS-31b]SCF96811.1 hypothetical protein GA0115256_138020 [Streptomyces sp. DconLS]
MVARSTALSARTHLLRVKLQVSGSKYVLQGIDRHRMGMRPQ